MKDYYKRQIQLWGDRIQKALKFKNIAIIGCGGLGCTLGLTLGGSGIGRINLVDFDTVEIHNIHRQIAFTKDDVGRKKCEVLKEVLEKRAVDSEFYSFDMDFKEFSKKNIKLDLIIDATDNLLTRQEIDSYAKQNEIPWVYGSVEEFNGQVCFFEKSSFSVFNLSDKKPEGIAPPMVSFIASFEANLALRYLANLPIEKDILHYFYFSNSGELSLQKYKMPDFEKKS